MTSDSAVYPGYTLTMSGTTVKVSTELRDRLNTEARRTGATVAQVIEALFAQRDRLERFEQIRRARAVSPRTAEDIEEDSLWESAAAVSMSENE